VLSGLITLLALAELQESKMQLRLLAFLGIWIIFSTIAAPIAIQRAITTGLRRINLPFTFIRAKYVADGT